MQGGHKPFSYVAISFSPKHCLICSRFCLVWTLLLCIWKTDGFAWLYVCVSLNLVTCVFYLLAYRTLLSAAERRGTPVLLSVSVSDNSSTSPQMAALRRSREIDQPTQRFHVGCGYANHGILLILDDTLNCNLLMWAK